MSSVAKIFARGFFYTIYTIMLASPDNKGLLVKQLHGYSDGHTPLWGNCWRICERGVAQI